MTRRDTLDGPLPRETDVLIIGGGVTGCAIAHALARFSLRTLVIEKTWDFASGASRGNAAAVHSGIDPPTGSFKAIYNVRGNALYGKLADQLGFPFERVGGIVVARSEDEVPALRELLDRGQRNGVRGLEIVGREQLKALEPNVEGVAALLHPTTGIITPQMTTFALAENACLNGVRLCRGVEATAIHTENGEVRGVRTTCGDIAARVVINAAGVYADQVARLVGDDSFSIHPRKGEYFVLDKHPGFVRRIVYPVPSKTTKGMCVVPTIDGNILVGPTADEIEDRNDTTTTEDARTRIFTFVKTLCPDVPLDTVINGFAGIRPVADTNDFIIRHGPVSGWINVAGIQSPGLTSAPAIAERVTELVNELVPLQEKRDHKPDQPAELRYANAKEMATRYRLGPGGARIVCRCEHVSEAEVVRAIRRPLGARTVDGVKHRTRAGMGRCQGGFCLPRIVAILARELGVPPTSVTKSGPGSEILVEETKRP